MTDFGYNEGTAIAYIESEGICVYCGDDMFQFRQGYSSAQIDHLLPSSKYPELKWNIKNWVFCCSSCNAMKHNLDVLKEGEDATEQVENNREKLIERVKQELSDKINQREHEYLTVKKIVKNDL